MHFKLFRTIKIKYYLLSFGLLFMIGNTFSQESNTKKGFDWDRIVIGGNLGAQFGNITIAEISPNIGYMVTDNLLSGIGGTYIYYKESS